MLLGDLRRRLPALRDRHEDLAQETLADLTARIERGGELIPPSWLSSQLPTIDEDIHHLSRLARTILRRRIADMFRARGRSEETAVDDNAALTLSDAAPHADRVAQIAQLVSLTSALLEELLPADREALLLSVERDGERVEGRMPDRDRQRLSRARARLLDKLRAHLGPRAESLLNSDD